MKNRYETIIKQITNARKNNINWMNLLKFQLNLPLNNQMLKNINKQDKKISQLLRNITNK